MSKRNGAGRPEGSGRAKHHGELVEIALDYIDEPYLPAREKMDTEALEDLKQSMSSIGLLSPIVVRRNHGRYATVAGHRRLLAARELKWRSIKCLVYPENWEFQEAAKLHENVIRESLNSAEEALYFKQLLETLNLDEAGLCEAVKRSTSYVAERLKLLRGNPQVFEALRSGSISTHQAKSLNKFKDPTWCNYYLSQTLRSGTAARVIDEWFLQWQERQTPEEPRAEITTAPAEVPAIEPHQFVCFLCGGHRDPWNMETVQIHKWERQEVARMLASAEERIKEEAGN